MEFTTIRHLNLLIDRLDKLADVMLARVLKYGTSLRSEYTFWFGYDRGDVNSDLKFDPQLSLNLVRQFYQASPLCLWGISKAPMEDLPELEQVVKMTKILLGVVVWE